MPSRSGPSRSGFSLVELMIAVMILAVGMLMIAGAFPVGLRYHEQSVDETIAGLLARTAVNRLTLPATSDGQNDFGDRSTRYRDCAGQMGVIECFQVPAADADVQVRYLFEGGSTPTHAGGVLEDAAKLGANINNWLPEDDRVYEADDRYRYQIFYRRVADPGTGSLTDSRTYVSYVVVQKSPDASGDALAPSGLLDVISVDGGARTIRLSGSFPVAAGASLLDCATGDWYDVQDVQGADIMLTRTPAGSLADHKVRVMNYSVAVFAGIVSKQLFQQRGP